MNCNLYACACIALFAMFMRCGSHALAAARIPFGICMTENTHMKYGYTEHECWTTVKLEKDTNRTISQIWIWFFRHIHTSHAISLCRMCFSTVAKGIADIVWTCSVAQHKVLRQSVGRSVGSVCCSQLDFRYFDTRARAHTKNIASSQKSTWDDLTTTVVKERSSRTLVRCAVHTRKKKISFPHTTTTDVQL